MSKLLLIHPEVRQQDVPRHIPLGVGSLAAVTKDKHEVAICDLNAHRDVYPAQEDRDQYLIRCLKSAKWDYVGVGGLSSQYKSIKRILPMIRKTNPECKVIAGGGWITYLPKEMMTLNPEIDIVAIGESELTIQELLTPHSPPSVKGIYYRESNQIVASPPRPLIENMDDLPYPAYDLMELDIYFKHSQTNDSLEASQCKRRLDIVAERGCPRQCAFCCHNGMSRWDQIIQLGTERVRQLDKEAGYFQAPARWNSPRYVVEQTWYLYNTYGVDFIVNMDENLCSNRKRVFDLCDRLIAEGLPKLVKWGSLGDTASVDDEMISKMKEAGCTYISYGGESASDRVLLKDIGKGVTRAHAQEAVDVMKRCQMRPMMTFQLGFPTESIDDILETVDFFIINNIHCDPFIDTPYPGSRYFVDHNDFILQQYDPILPEVSPISMNGPAERRLRALELFLLELDDATELSAHVSQNFNAVELLGLKSLMAKNDARRICQFAHDTNRTHSQKWVGYCDVCKETKDLIIGQNQR